MKNRKNLVATMPSARRYPSRTAWEEAVWRHLLVHPGIIESLCTAQERKNLVLRAAVGELLRARVTHRQISRELSVSRQTISAVRKAAKEVGYRSYRERGKTERRPKNFPDRRLMVDAKREEASHYRKTKYGRIRTH